MRILYIFPHPDDESFGPAAVMHQQLQAGHEVFLLTLTQGGATKERHRLGISVEEMGAVRYREMLAVEKVLGLTGMQVWDYPDSGLKNMDPRILENAAEAHITALKPDVIVTYAVHGISGFHDHLVAHAVVKRLYLDMRDRGHSYLKRLALLTIPDSGEPVFSPNGFRLKHSTEDEIDCVVRLRQEDRDMMAACLRCYETYQATIDASGVIKKVGDAVHFEFYGEQHQPPVGDILFGLQASP
ncbi:MAG: PIG-L family deacetylase [Bacteroidota bacterium]